MKEPSGVAGSGGWLSVGRFRIGCAGKPGPSLEIDPIPFMIC